MIAHFRGNELQNYFKKIVEDDLTCLMKPQYVETIPKAAKVLDFQVMLSSINIFESDIKVYITVKTGSC